MESLALCFSTSSQTILLYFTSIFIPFYMPYSANHTHVWISKLVSIVRSAFVINFSASSAIFEWYFCASWHSRNLGDELFYYSTSLSDPHFTIQRFCLGLLITPELLSIFCPVVPSSIEGVTTIDQPVVFWALKLLISSSPIIPCL